jgi:hypothetical protein
MPIRQQELFYKATGSAAPGMILTDAILHSMTQQSFEDAIKDIKANIGRYRKIEGRPWGVEGAVIELAKQVGQLSALVMNREEYYFSDREKLDAKYNSSNDDIGDELVDIITAVVRIADHYGIDLVAANAKTRKMEDGFLKSKSV